MNTRSSRKPKLSPLEQMQAANAERLRRRNGGAVSRDLRGIGGSSKKANAEEKRRRREQNLAARRAENQAHVRGQSSGGKKGK